MTEPSVRTPPETRFVLALHTETGTERATTAPARAIEPAWANASALLDVSYALSGALTSTDVAEAIQDWARERLGTRFVGLSLTEPAGQDGAGRLWIAGTSVPLTSGTALTRAALTGEPSAQPTPDLADLDFLRAAGVVPEDSRKPAVLHLPLRAADPSADRAGPVLGVLTFGWTGPHRVALDTSAFAVLDAFAAHAAQALGRAQAFEQERTVAQVLRGAVLPDDLPQPAGWRLAATYVPARRQPAVGGDWYDAFHLPDGRLALAIGDTAGHGLEAARVMSGLRNALRAYAVLGEGPRRVLERLDAFLAHTDAEAFATVVYLELSPADGTVDWASAGHPPPLVIPRGSTPPRFAAHPHHLVDPPLGVPPGASRHEGRFHLAGEDTMLLFTDGLVERRDRDVDAGLEELRATAADSASAESPGHLEAVLDRLLDAAGPADDVCVLALTRAAAHSRP